MDKAIELHAVDTIYEGEKIPSLKNINLHVNKGEFIAIIGPNGAGKTTLLETINGLLESKKGKVIVLGKELNGDGNGIRKLVGYVPQDYSIDELTPFLVSDVVLMGRFGKIGLLKPITKNDKEIAKNMIDYLGISDLSHRPIGKLSGGQAQKVMIARALAKEPEILLMDEPFSNLDFEARKDVSEKLSHFHKSKQMTFVIVIHDIASIPKVCNRIIVMDAGKIIADGKKEDILKPELLEMGYKGIVC
ncbi:MAG TPA: metal ABC transporter ATP-binding protein [Methanofastidiosum sp.]|jgi:zinc/manganese transport system ATP-binding protein|nr:metal ABC transporter ATP-binding protein [Methanofastidiosum sp.]HOC77888.1 metal ABC transporter ATP-binding protein [Methanofastidiosum sp.]HOG73527.1 metal ABC transporter ATP-binding protein [Methanofastidiosum sp.]HPA49102.1 metal ABC transporter ATP-binding protein [Methanofastidiosum sp.]HQK62727.1 metal ABC transporter ATP-binding protein [Methanofastidiosum sp.]